METLFSVLIVWSYFANLQLKFGIPLCFCFLLYETGLRWQFIPSLFFAIELYLLSYQGSNLIFSPSWLIYLFILSLALPFTIRVPTLPRPKYSEVGISTAHKKYWVLYPAVKGDTTQEWTKNTHKWVSVADYPLLLQNAIQLSYLPRWALNDLKTVDTHLTLDAPVLPRTEKKYPVVLFSHGLKGAPPMYITIAQELATRGFVVFSVFHSDGSSYLNFDYSIKIDDHEKRNFQVNVRSNDLIEVLNELEKQAEKFNFDPNQIALVGHSFGSASICKTAIRDKRIKCVVGLDPWLFPLSDKDFTDALPIPAIFLTSQEWQWDDNIERMRKILSKNGGRIVYIKKILHLNFSDSPYLAPQFLLKKMAIIGESDRDEVLEMMGILMASSLSSLLNLQENSYQEYISKGDELLKLKKHEFLVEDVPSGATKQEEI